jgi:hypothetical protein
MLHFLLKKYEKGRSHFPRFSLSLEKTLMEQLTKFKKIPEGSPLWTRYLPEHDALWTTESDLRSEEYSGPDIDLDRQ